MATSHHGEPSIDSLNKVELFQVVDGTLALYCDVGQGFEEMS
jgi:hypothetical protein